MVLTAVALMCCGCQRPAGTAGESWDEARAQAATCTSLLERRSKEPVEPVDPRIFQQAMRDPRFAEDATATVILKLCAQVAQRRGLPSP